MAVSASWRPRIVTLDRMAQTREFFKMDHGNGQSIDEGTSIRKPLSALIKDPLLEEIELGLRPPNIFYALRAESHEIRHSNFIGWLLDPQGNHGLGDLFLRHFLRDVFSEGNNRNISEFDVDSFELSGTEIRREWINIDILIVHERFVVSVENKVRSEEHSAQLARYREIVSRHFPRRSHAFVFLTPFGRSPADEQDAESYSRYSYAEIAHKLEGLLRLYGESMSTRVRIYIEDYVAVVRREIMKDDELNVLAAKIWRSHKDALDFVFDNRPDRLKEAGELFERAVVAHGYVLGSPNKGYARFLTKGLKPIIPHSAGPGWRDREAFLFELDLWYKTVKFKTVIAPGDEAVCDVLRNALAGVDGAKKPKGGKWLVHFNRRWKINVEDPALDDEQLQKKLEELWTEIDEIVERVESALLKVKQGLEEASAVTKS